MGIRATQTGHGRIPGDAHVGRRYAIASLAMLVVVFAASFLGVAFQNALGLEEQELLTDAGAWGWAAAVFLVMLIVGVSGVGVVLGLKARRLGERGLGTAGVVANAVIGGWFLLGSVVGLAFG